MVDQAVRFCSGNLRRSTFLFVLIPLIAIFYFGTLALAICLFPEAYDWRYRVISSLISPRYNPAFHWIPSFGIALAGLLMIPFGGYIRRHLGLAAPRMAHLGGGAFAAGAVALSLTAFVVSPHLHGPAGGLRMHEMLGRTAALGIGLGMVLFSWCLLKGRCLAPAEERLYPLKLLVLWTLLTLPPVLGLGSSEGLLLMARAQSSWSHAIYSGFRNSVVWHLGFWEWIGSAAVFLFLLSSALLLPERGDHVENATYASARK
ncbi:MAG: hypothetical protein JOY92_05370 [Verrucomicrobia bacterium]|nr:hypothetical protein [Verrucomicrobiota bacterium]